MTSPHGRRGGPLAKLLARPPGREGATDGTLTDGAPACLARRANGPVPFNPTPKRGWASRRGSAPGRKPSAKHRFRGSGAQLSRRAAGARAGAGRGQHLLLPRAAAHRPRWSRRLRTKPASRPTSPMHRQASTIASPPRGTTARPILCSRLMPAASPRSRTPGNPAVGSPSAGSSACRPKLAPPSRTWWWPVPRGFPCPPRPRTERPDSSARMLRRPPSAGPHIGAGWPALR